MRYFAQRLVFYAFTAWAAVTINFFVPRLTPGDPVQALIAGYQGEISTQAVHSLTVLFGLDKHQGLFQQYLSYLGQLARGDLGISFHSFPTPVTSVLAQSLPWTVCLVGVATLISFSIGTLLGVIVGWRRGGLADLLMPITTFFASIPYFWLALLAIAAFTGVNSFLPPSLGYDTGLVPGWNAAFIDSALKHSVLPAGTIVVTSVAGWLMGMRNMVVTVSSEDYVTVAHAKGLSERRVMFGYAARNALLPSVSGFGMALGLVVGGTFLVEYVFSYPGVGLELVTAIGQKDYPLMQGIFLVITLSVLAANFLADLAYMALDPRTRREG
jgi:peptide/nickel transport system permease protein